MPDWDDDSERLRRNLEKVLLRIRDRARRRDIPSVEDARGWQRDSMAGLDVPDNDYVGGFRGEKGKLANCQVRIGDARGVPPARVASALANFEDRLQKAVHELDKAYPRDAVLDADGLAAVLELAAWAHCEWVRIHPFANGNGRTARLWANSIMMRYGLPPVVRLRPRPDAGYSEASASAMGGNWQLMVRVFHEMLQSFLRNEGVPTTTPEPRST